MADLKRVLAGENSCEECWYFVNGEECDRSVVEREKCIEFDDDGVKSDYIFVEVDNG